MLKPICLFFLFLMVLFSSGTAQGLDTAKVPIYEGGYALLDIWGFGPNDVYAVGRYGVVVHYDGLTWETIRNDATTFTCIWGTSPTNIYTTNSESIYHYDGENWEIVFEGGEIAFISDIWGSGPDDIYAVGYNKILHYNGSQWEITYDNIQGERFYAVWGSGPTDVFAGSEDRILHYDGSTWSEMTDAFGGVTRLWGTAWNDVHAIGTRKILHYDGMEWTLSLREEEIYLMGIWGSGPDDVYAVGTYGPYTRTRNLFHYDGEQWSYVDNDIESALKAIWGSGPDDVFIIGSEWTIVHLGGPEVCIDNDGDGFGNPPSHLCQYPALDCDDDYPHISPAGQEDPFNDVDEDCNGELALDEGICFISLFR